MDIQRFNKNMSNNNNKFIISKADLKMHREIMNKYDKYLDTVEIFDRKMAIEAYISRDIVYGKSESQIIIAARKKLLSFMSDEEKKQVRINEKTATSECKKNIIYDVYCYVKSGSCDNLQDFYDTLSDDQLETLGW